MMRKILLKEIYFRIQKKFKSKSNIQKSFKKILLQKMTAAISKANKIQYKKIIIIKIKIINWN